ncbi:MAG: crossover junction endodeoxyribonuclease RuvC [Parachlamydiaceae bacterium]|nr:crossover junction endodeoxyribonuclease RuvC [Parachlamydiaceae bacterium]
MTEIIIGIDPGTTVTGYGIITIKGSSYQALDYGCIRPPAKMALSDRYLIIFESLEQILEKYKPEALSVETQFVKHNVQSAIKLGMARGIAILAAKRRGMSVFEYTPQRAKRSVVGNGRASKQQVQAMTQRLLNLASPPTPEDAADALALAICHAQAMRFQELCPI